ncbi:hypothetical protein ACMUMS_16355 [Acinetobacter courvalinii]|uniref:hypothetical protein n=1 Tax=Acinetobacter courvalinii TaxID=280147 RepID=UPI003A889484
MGLLSLIKENESSTFISLKEAINLLTKETGSTIQEVAIYLLNKDVSSELACHVKGSDYKIKETSGKHFSYGMFRPYGENWAFSYLTHISERHNCTTWDELETYSAGQWDDWGTAFPCGNVKLIENTYWYREAFFNLEPIKSLNLFDERLIKINPNLIPIWDINYVHIQELESLSYSELLNDNFS